MILTSGRIGPLAVLVFSGLLSGLAHAQEAAPDFDRVTLQVRPRAEWRDGYQRLREPGDNGILNTTQRTRLTWHHGTSKWEVKLGFQDVRVVGDMAGNQGYGAFAATESWGAWKPNDRTRITAGRQRIAFDNERIVGAVNWSQYGRFLDGIRWDQKSAIGKTTAALTWDAPAGLTRVMGHHTYKSEGLRASLLYFDQLNSSDQAASLRTAGFTCTNKPSNRSVAYLIEAYFQQGHVDASTAYMGVAELHLQTARAGKGLVAVDWLEGDARGRAFKPFLGTNHRHYGWMDQFYVGIPANGLVDARVHWSKPFNRPSWKAKWDLRYHRFYNATWDALYANELDAVVVFTPTESVKASFGWSVMNATDAMYASQGRISGATGLQQWGWIALNFSPTVALNQSVQP